MKYIFNILLLSALSLSAIPASASLIQHWTADFGVVPFMQRKTIGLTFGSDINSVSQTVGNVVVSGSGDFKIENDGCSGASIPRGAECFFDIVFKPSVVGFQEAQFYFDWVSQYHDPVEDVTVPADGRVYYHVWGRTCGLALQMTTAEAEIGPDLKVAKFDQNDVGLISKTTITGKVTVTDGPPECVKDKVIKFSAVPIESSGHDHAGPRPTGKFNKQGQCTTNKHGVCIIEFSAGQVSGVERLRAEFLEDANFYALLNVNVGVPGLVRVEDVAGSLIGTLFDLVGWTGTHTDNHYFNPAYGEDMIGIATQLFETYQARPQLNDMSLIKGGLFDIGDKNGIYWKSPHLYHRTGSSMDFNHCAVSAIVDNPNSQNGPVNPNPDKLNTCPLGSVWIFRRVLKTICRDNNASIVKEQDNYHCDFNHALGEPE